MQYYILLLGRVRLGAEHPDYHTLVSFTTQILIGHILLYWEMVSKRLSCSSSWSQANIWGNEILRNQYLQHLYFGKCTSWSLRSWRQEQRCCSSEHHPPQPWPSFILWAWSCSLVRWFRTCWNFSQCSHNDIRWGWLQELYRQVATLHPESQEELDGQFCIKYIHSTHSTVSLILLFRNVML